MLNIEVYFSIKIKIYFSVKLRFTLVLKLRFTLVLTLYRTLMIIRCEILWNHSLIKKKFNRFKIINE